MSSAPETTIKFTDFVELILARVFEQERTHGPSKSFHLVPLAKELKASVPEAWVRQAGEYLRDHGLLNADFALGGLCAGSLTGDGRVYVEEKMDEDGSVIKAYLDNPAGFLQDATEGDDQK